MLDHRLEQHLTGKGSVATRLAYTMGYTLEPVEIWTHATPSFETYLQKNFTCSRCGYAKQEKKKVAKKKRTLFT